MFGLDDFWTWSVYLLCILSTLLCVVYGLIMWNKGMEEPPTSENIEWVEEEKKIGEEL